MLLSFSITLIGFNIWLLRQERDVLKKYTIYFEDVWFLLGVFISTYSLENALHGFLAAVLCFVSVHLQAACKFYKIPDLRIAANFILGWAGALVFFNLLVQLLVKGG